jgi:PIN domain nuclease of toxin-antitoxin system
LKILLDSNALIWLQNSTSGGLIGKKAKEQIINADAVYASSISILEINIKAMLGKIGAPETLLDNLVAAGIKTYTLPLSMRKP